MEKRIKWQTCTWIAIILSAAIIAAFQIFSFAERQKDRDIASWQARLTTLAEERAKSINLWLHNQNEMVETIAQNTSVRLYLSTIENNENENNAAIIAAQRDYLGNLLSVSATQLGLNSRATRPQVNANIAVEDHGSLALLNANGAIIAAFGVAPDFDLAASLNTLAPFDEVDGALFTQTLKPIHAVQSDTGLIGYVYFRKPAVDDIKAFLKPSDNPDHISQAYMVQQDEDLVRTIVPGAKSAYFPVISTSDDRRFYRLGREDGAVLLATSSPLDSAGYALLVAVVETTILNPIHERQMFMMVTLGLTVAFLIVALLLAWRHGASVRVERAIRGEQQTKGLLQLVANEQPTAVFIVDGQDKVVFANQIAAILGHVDARDLKGKTLAAIFGANLSQPFFELMKKTRTNSRQEQCDAHFDFGHGVRRGRLLCSPLHHGDLGEGAVLLIWDDLSELLDAQAKRELTLSQLMGVLTGLIDARDPHSAAQSRRLAQLSEMISKSLSFDTEATRRLCIASHLLNLGKVLVPRELLTKAGKLNKAELQQVHDALTKSAELLAEVDFDAPILPLIEAAHGDHRDIEPAAAALRVMNAFISMISPRAHRKALTIDNALEVLRANPQRYDRASISALSHLIDNEGGREIIMKWQSEAEANASRPAL